MSAEICAVQPEQQAELAGFLSAAFGKPIDAPFVSAEMLAWKYFEPRPDWSGPRSKVVREEGRIVAHAGVWPLRFLAPGGPVDCVHLIDWGAAGAAGAGILIYREMLRSAAAALVVGGAIGARKLLTRMGFSQAGCAVAYVRVVRPWKQFRLRPAGPKWKNAAKLMRNSVWASAGRAEHAEWSMEALPAFPRELQALLDTEPASLPKPVVAGVRTVEGLNFLLRCPGAQCTAHVLKKGGALRGYFLLCRGGRQSRIADLRVWGTGADLAAAYSLAVEAAARDPEICEIVAVSSLDATAGALAQNGFRIGGERPVWLYDPQGRFANAGPLHVQAIESDSFFLYDAENSFAS